ncbi:phosphatase PAP2 family protein [Streptomyces sp. NPDC048483]|uniref:phosphatase PAP2 family protein n=1 Tax=Streptomyces sp. NPDC048483 TaxID=3154927 RepID=UPI003449F565
MNRPVALIARCRSGLSGVRGPTASVSLGALAGFVLLTLITAGRHDAPLSVDVRLLSWSVAHRPDVAVAVARGATATGTGVVPYALAVLAGAVAGRTARQRLVAAAASLFCLGAGQALRYAVMHLLARARPPVQDWATHASGWSYPSGHATTAAITAALLVTAVLLRSPPGRTLLALAVGCWGMAVGLTRVYLGVHWFSDVVGGWLFAMAWFGMCACVAARRLPGRAPEVTDTTDLEDHQTGRESE